MDVHQISFYRKVNTILELQKNGLPTFLTMTKGITMVRNDIPHNSFVISGETFLSCLEDSEIPKNTKEARKMLSRHKGMAAGAFKCFKLMLKDPTAFSTNKRFHVLAHQCACLHIIRPIEMIHSMDLAAVVGLHKMLILSGVPVISLEELSSRTTKDGLVSCDCGIYLKRGWCKHVCTIAMDRKIITGFPGKMNPISTLPGGKKTAGRFKNATIGGALIFE